jgi:protease-4
MFRTTLGLLLLAAGTGCERFVVRTQNRVAFDGPVDTRVTVTGPVETRVHTDLPPVSPLAGRVRPVTVRAGDESGRVAILDIDGLLLNTPFVGPLSVGENPVSLFREKLDAVEADPCVRAVVLRVNSHGGGVAATAAMRRDLDRFKARTKLPVVACLMDTAAGGAYQVAAGADQIVVGPATVTGGLGVVLNLFNLKDLMLQFNVQPQSVKAGEFTDIGSSARPLTDDETKLLQAMADDFQAQIKADVVRGRPHLDPADKATFDGRIFTANQAVARKLADRVGDLDDGPTTPAYTVYSVTPNVPLQGAGLLPNVPGLDRSKLPTFLSLWQPELTMEKLGGK